jgi:hypothetical protein
MLLRLKKKLAPIMIDPALRRLSMAAIFFNLSAWVLLTVRLFPFITGGRLIALHYNIYLNVNDVGQAGWSLATPAIGTAIILINFWLAVRSYASSRQNTLVILLITGFYELLILASSFFIILINLTR